MKKSLLIFISCDHSLENFQETNFEEDLREEREIVQEKKEEDFLDRIDLPPLEKKFSYEEIFLEEKGAVFSLKGENDYFLKNEVSFLNLYLSDSYEKNLGLKELPLLINSQMLGKLDNFESFFLQKEDALFFFQEELVNVQLRKYENFKIKFLNSFHKGEFFQVKNQKPGYFFLTKEFKLEKEKAYILIQKDKTRIFKVSPGYLLEEALKEIDESFLSFGESVFRVFNEENKENKKWINFHPLKTKLKENEIYPLLYYEKSSKSEELTSKKETLEILEEDKKIFFEQKELILGIKNKIYIPIFQEFKKSYTGYVFSIHKKKQDSQYIGSFASLDIHQRIYKGEKEIELEDKITFFGYKILKKIAKDDVQYYHLKRVEEGAHLFVNSIFFKEEILGPYDPIMRSCKESSSIFHKKSYIDRMRAENRLLTRVYNYGNHCHLPEGTCLDPVNLDRACSFTALNEYPLIYEKKNYYYRQVLEIELIH